MRIECKQHKDTSIYKVYVDDTCVGIGENAQALADELRENDDKAIAIKAAFVKLGRR